MAQHNEIGRLGEQLAEKYLKQNNYEILETNWRYSRAEIDIIAKENGVLVFVEVKSRSNDRFGNPEDSISEKKRSFLADAATRYMEIIGHEWEIRFDVISLIISTPEKYTIDHFKDSFFPGW